MISYSLFDSSNVKPYYLIGNKKKWLKYFDIMPFNKFYVM